jgi:regulator of sigma E protease
VVKREGKKETLKDVEFGTVTEDGVVFGEQDFWFEAEEKTPLAVLRHTASQMRLSVKMVYESLFDLVSGRYGFEQVSGPVGTAGAIGDVLKEDLAADPDKGQNNNGLLYLAMIITVNLGLMNLLPIPALDGGRLFFQTVELIFRRPIPTKYEGYIHGAGIVILMGFMLLITFKDVFGLFS